MDIYIIYFLNLSANNILEAFKYKNNDEIINFYNNYLFYNKLSISLSRYSRENKPIIYKDKVYFKYYFHKIFSTNYFSISFKSSKLLSISFNKSQIKNIYKPSDFFDQETVMIKKIFYKKELNYNVDNIRKGNGIIQKYCPFNESLKNEFLLEKNDKKNDEKMQNVYFSFVHPLLKSLFFLSQFSIPIILIIKPEIISNNNISINSINKINNKEITVIYFENSQINNKNELNIKSFQHRKMNQK